MIQVVPYKAEHLLTLNLQRGQEYCVPSITPVYAKQLEATDAYTVLAGDRPVAVGGVFPIWDNRALVWSFMDSQAGPYFCQIHKAVLRFLDSLPYRRLEADTPCEFEAGHRWLRLLGFKMEAERMRAYMVDGGDAALYAKVKHD